MSKPIQWLSQPEDHDYPAAVSYLSLIFPGAIASQHVEKLKSPPAVCFKAKDILRASALARLGTDNSHVAKGLAKIDAAKSLSPLLLVRDTANERVIVADGFHRLCAVYARDEDAVVPCKIV